MQTQEPNQGSGLLVGASRSLETLRLRATSRNDVQRFIEAHAEDKNGLIVDVDPAGIGDCWADRLEDEGFTVRRIRG